ncbi:MAG: hypothetical protein A3K19_26360 [Lentisphaerae bacterium RIFOXYB12_FULL_65_16]|nr:MAG: hypothetical protein A3K18_08530 [Lentisphaerae bacterium RIFOXYA12_64_32]OGV87799.1 MAG: hypothetical protein A3K19_26360 [Lentisphaerae bacterium RIFOXYB12_FULL_65_16]
MQAGNVVRLDGVLALGDSVHRDRWGVDGYQPGCVLRDVDPASGPVSAGPACWASDNWDATHALVLVLPRRVSVTAVTLHWPKQGGAILTPRRLLVQGSCDGRWADLAEVRREQPEAVTRAEFAAAAPLEAVRVVLPPDGANPAADRRLWLAGIAVDGTPVEPAAAVDTAKLKAQFEAELRELRQREDAERVAPALAVVMQQRKPRGFMGIIDADDVARGRRNVAARPWAKDAADRIVKDADWWLGQSDEYIYGLVPAGNPRALCPQFEKGCPIHGGARQSFTATLESPYRWRCRKGGEEWYDGAVVKNPKTGVEVTVRDDGNGWLAPDGFAAPGRRYFFVAAYRYFLIGKLFHSPYEGDGGSTYHGGTPVVQLALAYAITGDARYAHKCAVMLNRLAELYRTYDGCIEGPTQRQDGYIGQTSERFLAQNLELAADLIWDEIEKDAPLREFFAAKGNADYDGDGRVTGADLTFNLQRNLFGYVYEYLHRLMPYMDGDFIMYEMTALAVLARVLGNADILAETLESDLGLRVLLTNSWFRDGKFIYDSTGYNVGNAQTPLRIAEWLDGMAVPPRFPAPLDLYHHPDYRMAMLFDFLRYVDCDGRPPQIGDVGGSRARQGRTTPPYDAFDEWALLRLPEQREFYSARLDAASNGDLEGFRRGRADWWLLFHAGEAPAPAPATPGAPLPGEASSHLFDDSGIAILRAGNSPATRQHVPVTFSKGGYAHGHGDKLALNVFRFGYDLTADLGYPTTWTDIKYGGWETHTASHCTVMLDEARQQGNVIGRLHWFATDVGVDAVEASAEPAYAAATLYRRTVAQVRDDQGEALYTIDVFRTAGTTTRDYLFHALGKPEEMTVELADTAAAWTAQPKGSLAGEGVEPMTRAGYSFLFDLQRARTDNGLTARWQPVIRNEQPDRYLLTRKTFRDFTADFNMLRTGKTPGERQRALFAFRVDPGNVENRCVAWLDAGGAVPAGEPQPDRLFVGKPVQIRVAVAGGQASVFVDGQLKSQVVDPNGTPPAEGAIGFMNYYSYDYEFRDLVITPAGGEPVRVDLARPLDPGVWARIDPTYSADAGSLRASDSEAPTLCLRMLGAPGRDVIRAKAEGYGVRGQSPFEGHLIVRERPSDKASPSVFAGVIEATLGSGPTRVKSIEPVKPASGQETAWAAAAGVAMKVVTAPQPGEERVDYVFSALSDRAEFAFATDAGDVRFQGRFGFLTTRAKAPGSLMLVGQGHLSCGAKRVDLPAPVLGTVTVMEPDRSTVAVRLDPGSPTPAAVAGQRALVTHPDFASPAVYTVVGSEAGEAGAWRLQLNMPFTVARGVVRSVDPGAGAFAAATPVMKLRVNPHLFDGKYVLAGAKGTPRRLKTAAEAAFVLAAREAIVDFAAGGEFIVWDIGPGDRIEIVPQGSMR